MDLGSFNDERALTALIQIASNLDEDEMIFRFMRRINRGNFNKKRRFDSSIIEKLTPVAKGAVYSFIKGMKPEWLEKP